MYSTQNVRAHLAIFRLHALLIICLPTCRVIYKEAKHKKTFCNNLTNYMILSCLVSVFNHVLCLLSQAFS